MGYREGRGEILKMGAYSTETQLPCEGQFETDRLNFLWGKIEILIPPALSPWPPTGMGHQDTFKAVLGS